MSISSDGAVIIKRLEQIDTRLARKPSMPDEPGPLVPMRSAHTQISALTIKELEVR